MKKNGFTLVELLAVLVVLVIILMIAITRIKKVVDNSADKSIEANAGVAIKAINNAASNVNIMEDSPFQSGLIEYENLKEYGVSISGTEPDSGFVLMNNYEVAIACFQYGNYKIEYNSGKFSKPEKAECSSVTDVAFDFDYTGTVQKFVVPMSGTYKIELWGASGTGSNISEHNAIDSGGAYTSGEIELSKGQELYFYVGSQGIGYDASSSVTFSNVNQTFNGGGKGNRQCGDGSNYGGITVAGGATDVRTISGTTWSDETSLRSRIMVAAASGGTTWNYNSSHIDSIGGAGGGLLGYDGTRSSYGTGATQISGGSINGAFGIGGNGTQTTAACNMDNAGGGGSGWYGGGGATATGSNTYSSGGGGSSYISGHRGCVAVTSELSSAPKCSSGSSVDCSESWTNLSFTNTVMIDGEGYSWTDEKRNYIGQTQPDGTVTKGHKGNGFARISLQL